MPKRAAGLSGSLRVQLLTWLLPIAGLALLVGTLGVYLIAVDASEESLDQGLLDAATLYAEHLREWPEALGQDMPPQAQRVLLVMREDRMFFALRDAAGRTLAGDAKLPVDLEWGSLSAPVYSNFQHAGFWLRGMSVVFDADGRALQLILATTDRKREKLMGEILLGMVTPQVLLFLVTIALVWAGIRRGLEPVAELEAEIALRSHSDLRPLDPDTAPDELRPMVREINELFARLDGAIEAQRHFIADAAHQLRTPVAGLLAQVESDGGVNPALAVTARRLSRLVAQLLALSRAEPGVEPERVEFDLAAAVREVAEEWLPRAFKRDMDLQFDLTECRLTGSPHALREMLANLLDNAIRYGREGGRAVIRCRPEGDAAVLRVEDDGPGIPAAEREKVLERFYRLPGTGPDGCGLGLPIVLGLARQHGGGVVLDESPELGGLRVTVALPR